MTKPDTKDVAYTNREIREKWHDIANSLSILTVQMANGFKEIKDKQNATDALVHELQLGRAKNDGFNRAFSIVGVIAWTLAMSVTGWILIQIISLETTLDSKIQTAVQTALSNYNIDGN